MEDDKEKKQEKTIPSVSMEELRSLNKWTYVQTPHKQRESTEYKSLMRTFWEQNQE